MSKHSIIRLGPNAFLKGNIVYTRGGQKPVHSFKGIPYAQPPVGHLRFKRPEPIPLWSGTKDALNYGPICPQPFGPIQEKMYSSSGAPPTMNEDCLYLNVWTPKTRPDAKLPVMVWIHGGGFVYGFSNFFDGTAYADKQDIVFVSINYRLGIFGFMCLGDENAAGNMGLLDQVQALRWIKENISAFGGDPNNVTIFGESAGGTSVSHHTLSKLTEGLFHRIICQSGVNLHEFWFWPPNNATKYITKRLQGLGCPAKTSEGIIQWLSTQDAKHLADSLGEGFFPVFDQYYISDDPRKLYAKGDFHNVPAMMGFTSHEGTMFVFQQDTSRKSLSSYEEAQLVAKQVIVSNFFRGKKNANKVCEAAWDLYIGQEKDLTKISESVVDMMGDIIFVVPTYTAADFHSARCPTYMYIYRNKSVRSEWPDWIEADHGDEVEFVIGIPFLNMFPDVWPEEEKIFCEKLMTYWANFARTGNPNGPGLPNWSTYTATSKNIMPLAQTQKPASMIDPKRFHFWTVRVPQILEGSEASKL